MAGSTRADLVYAFVPKIVWKISESFSFEKGSITHKMSAFYPMKQTITTRGDQTTLLVKPSTLLNQLF